MNTQEDVIRVVRLIEYEGPRTLVEAQVAASIQGTRYGMCGKTLGPPYSWPRDRVRITAVTLGAYPDVIEEARRVPVPKQMQDLLDEVERLQMRVQELHAVAQEAAR